MYELFHDQARQVLATGSYYECLGEFQRREGGSYTNHRKYGGATYTIRPAAPN